MNNIDKETITVEYLIDVVKSQKKIIEDLNQTLSEYKKEITDLKDEILKLKKETVKPKIKPSKLNKDNNDDKVALPNSEYIQTDDTGARHDGHNAYCTQIGYAGFTQRDQLID